MNANTPLSDRRGPITLEDVLEHKDAVKDQLDDQKEKIVSLFQEIVAPMKPAPAANPLMKSINKGIAVVDGVVIGMRVFKQLKKFLHRKKK